MSAFRKHYRPAYPQHRDMRPEKPVDVQKAKPAMISKKTWLKVLAVSIANATVRR